MGKPPIQYIEDEDHTVIDTVEWRANAACKGIDTRWWFADNNPTAQKRAREICSECPVSIECLEFAIVNNIYFGLWGGANEQQRRDIKRQWKKENKSDYRINVTT